MRILHSLANVITLGILISLTGSPLAANDESLNLSADDSLMAALSMTGPSGTSGHAIELVDASAPCVVEPEQWFAEPDCDSTQCGDCDGCASCLVDQCSSPWRVRFVPYGWLFEVQGTAGVRGVTVPVSVSYRDTLRFLTHDVDFIFSGKLEIENDEFGLIVDGFYVKAALANGLGPLTFNSSLDMTIVNITGTYNLIADAEPMPYLTRFDALAGIRIWSLSSAVTATGPLVTASASGTRDWVDPFIGGRVISPLAEGTEAQIRGDIGGFDWGEASQFTWQLEALISKQCSDCCSLRAGYRILDVNNHQGSGASAFVFDVQFRGPVAELAIEF